MQMFTFKKLSALPYIYIYKYQLKKEEIKFNGIHLRCQKNFSTTNFSTLINLSIFFVNSYRKSEKYEEILFICIN